MFRPNIEWPKPYKYKVFLHFCKFVDLCILLGCDYCPSIKGIGPKRATELIKQFKNIETLVTKIDKNKYIVPENWGYDEARKLFIEPEVEDPEKIEVRYIFLY